MPAIIERLVFEVGRGCKGIALGRVVRNCGVFSARATATSRALGKRSAGCRARQRRITDSQALMSGTKLRGDRGASVNRLNAEASGLSPVKGLSPVSIS